MFTDVASYGFNPTLVRFCPSARLSAPQSCEVSIPPWFDFAALDDTQMKYYFAGFNPTLVRFCPTASTRDAKHHVRFQSHLGSILPAAGSCLRTGATLVSIPPWFDFACETSRRHRAGTLVSIPPWFDFAKSAHHCRVRHTGCFNPTLVRFRPIGSASCG